MRVFKRAFLQRGLYPRGLIYGVFSTHLKERSLSRGGGGGLYYFRLQVDGPITGGPYKRRGGRGKGVRLLSGTLRCLCCHQG